MPRVEVRFDGVSRGARRAADDTAQGIDRVGAAARRNEGRVASFGRSARSSLAGVAGVAARLAVTLGSVAAGGLAGAVIFTGFRFNDLKQRAQIAFATMLNSGQKARAFLGELAAFAAKTPFEFKELIPLSQRLLAAGFEAKKVIPILRSVGDAVSAMGGDPEALQTTVRAITQIQAKGRVMAEEMMQLNEAGTFSWRALADAIGTDVPKAMKLVEKGAVSSEAFMAAFVANTNKRFGGMSDRISHTFTGLWSTIKDTFAQASGKAMEPFFNLATRGMQSIVDWSSKPAFTAGVERLSMWLEEHAVPALQNLARWLIDNRDGFADAFRKAAGFAQGFARAIGHVKDALAPLTSAFSIDMVKAGELAFGAVLLGKIAKVRLALVGTGAAASNAGLLGALGRLTARRWAIAIAVVVTWKFTGDWSKRFSDWLEGKVGDKKGFGFLFDPGAPDRLGNFVLPGSPFNVGDSRVTGKLPSGLLSPIPTGQGQGIIGTPGVGTHDQSDFQSRNAVDVKVRPGTPVLAPEPMRVVSFKPGPATPTRSGTKILFGDQVQYLGQSGTSYFVTHMRSTARRAGVFFAKGSIIGFAVNAGAGTHVHIATDRGNPVDLVKGASAKVAGGFAGKTPAAGDTAAGAPVAGGPDFGDAADLVGAGAGDAADKFDRGELKGPRATLAAMRRMLSRLVSPELKRKFREQIQALFAELGNVDTDKELTKLKRKLGKLQDAWADAMSLRDQLPAARRLSRQLADRIALLPDEIREKMMPRLRRLQEELGHVITEKQLDRIKRDMDRIRDRVEAAVDRMRERVAAKKEAFGDAFQKLTDKALRVFDAQTERLVRSARAKVARFGFEIGEGEETPSERRLREFREGREAEQRARRRAEIEQRIAELSVAKEGETADERQRRLDDLASAQQDMHEFALDEQESSLAKQADVERNAANEALEAERERIRVERELMRERFQQRLAEIQKGVADEKLTTDQAQAEIIQLLREYGVDYAEAGALIGSAFAAAFQEALGTVADALHDLAQAFNDVTEALGRGRPIPETDWSPNPPNIDVARRKGEEVMGFAHGGRVPGVWMGREDTMLARLTPGETVIDRDLTRMLEVALAGGGLGGVTFAPTITGNTMLGESETMAAQLAKLLLPYLDRVVRYRVP